MEDHANLGILLHENSELPNRIRAQLPGWQWIERQLRSRREDMDLPAGALPAVIVICACRELAAKGLLACKSLRGDPHWEGVPLLIIVDRYNIQIGNAVRRMPAADFLLAPFDSAALASGLGELGIQVRC